MEKSHTKIGPSSGRYIIGGFFRIEEGCWLVVIIETAWLISQFYRYSKSESYLDFLSILTFALHFTIICLLIYAIFRHYSTLILITIIFQLFHIVNISIGCIGMIFIIFRTNETREYYQYFWNISWIIGVTCTVLALKIWFIIVLKSYREFLLESKI